MKRTVLIVLAATLVCVAGWGAYYGAALYFTDTDSEATVKNASSIEGDFLLDTAGAEDGRITLRGYLDGTGNVTMATITHAGIDAFGYEVDGTALASTHLSDTANIVRYDGTGTITGNLVNTANPWADAEVSDTLTASLFVGSGSTTNAIDLATAEIAGELADANVSDTLTASVFVGEGSATDAVDLGTAEVEGELADAQVSDTLTASNFVGEGSLTDAVDLGTAETEGELSDAQVSNTLTASALVGSGSTTDAVDLATAEVSGVLPAGNVGLISGTPAENDTIRYNGYNWVRWPHAAANGDTSFDVGNTAAIPLKLRYSTEEMDDSLGIAFEFGTGEGEGETTHAAIISTIAATESQIEIKTLDTTLATRLSLSSIADVSFVTTDGVLASADGTDIAGVTITDPFVTLGADAPRLALSTTSSSAEIILQGAVDNPEGEADTPVQIQFYIDGVLIGHIGADGVYTDDAL